MYIPAPSKLEPWQLWWLRNTRCNFKATTLVGCYDRMSKLDLKDTRIKSITANDEDITHCLSHWRNHPNPQHRTKIKLPGFGAGERQDSLVGGLLKFPANLRGTGKFFPVSVDICQTKWGTFSWTLPNLDVVYSCLAVMTTLEVTQKEIVLTGQKQVKWIA